MRGERSEVYNLGLTPCVPLNRVRLLFFTLIIFSLGTGVADSVSVIPNKAVIKGTVAEYCLISSGSIGIKPEMPLNKLTITVEEVEDENGHPNFLSGKKGQNIIFYSKEKLPQELYGQKIKAVVEYVGDERGGKFWIKDIKVIKK